MKTESQEKKSFKIMQVREIGVIIPVVAAIILFGSINLKFLSGENVINILRNTSFVFIAAIGMTFLIISGGLDLSIGAQLALGGILAGVLMTNGVPILLAILVALVIGAGIGVINGLLIEKVRIVPFLTTMATMYIIRGVILISRKGVPVYPLPESFNKMGQTDLFYIPYAVIIAVVLGIIAHLVMAKTVYGRMIYAVGGNSEASRHSGIPTVLIRFSAYIIMGVLAAASGILQAARYGSAQPSLGQGFEMQAIAAVIIGGTSFLGGSGTILGTALGSLFMAILSNGMTLIHVSAYWQQLVLGVVIILAIAMDNYRVSLKK